ncbi:MAG: LacI family DNA-binding transcriptional regulator, partial [Planctomycetota bacterium]
KRMKTVNREIAERLDEAGISVVLLDRDLDRLPNRSRFDLVSIDNFRVGFMQTDYMFELGCKKIAYVGRGDSAPTIDLRIFGYKSAFEQRKLKYNPSLIFSGNVDEDDFVKKLAKSKPDAIVCSNDSTAAGLIKTFLRLGIQVPDDCRIIGVDDVKISNMTTVPLTSVHQPCRELGRAAVATMIRRIENRKMGAQTILAEVEIVVRESCGSKKTAK